MNYEDRVTKAAVEAAISDGVANAIVCGAYTGDGQAARVIELGFTPRAVLVFDQYGRTNMYSDPYNHILGGLMLAGYPVYTVNNVLAAQIVDGGFTVSQFSSETYYKSGINATNRVYHYLALV